MPAHSARLRPAGEHNALAAARELFRSDVLTGLSQPQKAIPPKYFYDATGSQLFDRICALPEYYLTRTETALLRAVAPEIAAHAGADIALIEFGSGSSTKVRILLDALESPAAYVPVDISGTHMRQAARLLKRDYADLAVLPVEADFTGNVALPPEIRDYRPLGFFPGSTIGNFSRAQAESFLRDAAWTLGTGAHFLIGVDLKKPRALLDAAYNDAAGITAAFNLNLLARINRELGGTFDLKAFRHRAFYNAPRGQIEMHLESLGPQSVRIAGERFAFRVGETIHTEISVKYSVAEFQAMAGRAGWRPAACFTDPERLFSLHYLVL